MVDLDLAARLARRSLRRATAQRRFPKIPMRQMPILFGNSFPKSGTHLLTQVLAGFNQLGPIVESGLPPFLTFEGESGKRRPVQKIVADLERLLPGDIGYGHLHAIPEVAKALCRDGVALYFVYRDPRDVVVSHVFYVSDINNRHVHHDYYTNELRGFDERLRVSIQGRSDLEISFPNIYARFEPYLPWLTYKEARSLRFEDLLEHRQSQLGKVFDHALERGFLYQGSRDEAIAALARAIDPQSSPTFRSGKAGGWREHFKPEHKQLFKDLSGDLLVRLGYEQNQNW